METDREILIWIHERFEHKYGESRLSDPKVNNKQPDNSQYCPNHQTQDVPARPFFDQKTILRFPAVMVPAIVDVFHGFPSAFWMICCA